MLSQQVEFQVDWVVHPLFAEVGDGQGMRDDPDRERGGGRFRDGQRDSVDRDAPLVHDVTHEFLWHPDAKIVILPPGLEGLDAAEGIDMTRHEMTAYFSAE